MKKRSRVKVWRKKRALRFFTAAPLQAGTGRNLLESGFSFRLVSGFSFHLVDWFCLKSLRDFWRPRWCAKPQFFNLNKKRVRSNFVSAFHSPLCYHQILSRLNLLFSLIFFKVCLYLFFYLFLFISCLFSLILLFILSFLIQYVLFLKFSFLF